MKKNVGILIFENAEVLDFAGPFEVFSVTSQINGYESFNVFTVAKDDVIISAVNGLLVKPNYTITNHPDIDILIIAGGQGTRKLLDDSELLEWVRKIHSSNELTLSIYTGAGVLAKLGLLEGKPYCTHQSVYDFIGDMVPTAIPQKEKRFVQSAEKIYTAGGISAGIDLSFHIVEILLGKETAIETAEYMEYDIDHTKV